MEETGVLGENHQLVASHWQTLSHNVVSSAPCHERGSNSQLNSVVIGTRYIKEIATLQNKSLNLMSKKNIINIDTSAYVLINFSDMHI